MAQVHDDIETIRLSPFLLDGKDHVDIRYWKWTRNGPRPTKKGIAISRAEIIQMIVSLQRVNSAYNSDDAKKEAAVNG